MQPKKPEHSTTYRRVNFDGDLHVVPQDDWFEHLFDVNCPCNPQLDTSTEVAQKIGTAGASVFVHLCIKLEKEKLS